ncbi:hypothetical protein [Enterococcus alishanensis]|uniref:hypothetical protein n=1 Tax=Enterococcus alishanensis TaxID=1303817 RepID=UPI0031B8489F
MDTDEIGQILSEAQLHNKLVAIQKQEVDQDGRYSDDVVGAVVGYDELGIFIGGQKVHYDEIRNVEFVEKKSGAPSPNEHYSRV